MKKLLQATVLLAIAATAPVAAQKFAWSNTGGGATGYEDAFGIATDSVGNSVFVGPYTSSAQFGTFTLNAVSGSQDIYIAKINASGTYVWVSTAGSKAGDGANDVTMDALGNTYIVGTLGDTAMFGSIKVNPPGFLAVYNASGVCQWAKSVPAGYVHKVALDKSGNIYVTGNYSGTAIFGSTTLTSAGSEDIFIAKYDNSGNPLWANSIGGPNDEYSGPGSVVADKAGNVYVAGVYLKSANIGTTALAVTNSGGQDSVGTFVAKYTTAGNFVWVKQPTSAANSTWINDICLNPMGDALYVTGSIHGSTTFGTTTLGPVTGSSIYNPFLVKMDTTGSFTWAITAKSSAYGKGTGVAVDTAGNVYCTGYVQSGTFTLGTAGLHPTTQDSYIARATSAGVWQWGKTTGVSVFTYNDGGAISTDKKGNVYHAARYEGTINLDGHPRTSSSSGFSWDAYVCMLDPTIPSGINELSAFAAISIYPNPVNGNLNIYLNGDELKDVTVNVFDISGRMVYTEKISARAGEANTIINTESYSKGMYFVQLVTADEAVTKKIIVE